MVQRDESLEKVRSRRKSLNRVLEFVAERAGGQPPVEVGIIQAVAEEEAADILELVKEQLKPERISISTLTPVVGTHGGPGTLGIAFRMV